MSLTHATAGLTASATQPIAHLHTVNPYCVPALETGTQWVLPRQAAGFPYAAAPEGNPAGGQDASHVPPSPYALGISAYAFQVGSFVSKNACMALRIR